MKKKILIILPIFIFALVFLYKMPSYATTFERGRLKYTLPNEFAMTYNWETASEIFTDYGYITESGYSNCVSIMANEYESGATTLITQTDMEEEKQTVIDSYKGSEDVLILNNDLEGKMVVIDGVPGYQITYTVTQVDNGLIFSHCYIEANSDHVDFSLWLSGPGQYVYSNEAKNIIDSIKINDTITEIKGIPFTDVSTNAWYYNAVKYTYQNNLISGLDKTTFGPNEKLTRGMIVTILWRMENAPANDGKSKFTDVASSAWYAQAVKWAAANKIVSGYSGTTNFGPKDNVTRQDLAVILRNYANYKGKSISDTADLSSFKDAGKTSNYAKPAMQWAVAKGVITGNAKTKTLNPKENATRAETAAMIVKYCDNVGK